MCEDSENQQRCERVLRVFAAVHEDMTNSEFATFYENLKSKPARCAEDLDIWLDEKMAGPRIDDLFWDTPSGFPDSITYKEVEKSRQGYVQRQFDVQQPSHFFAVCRREYEKNQCKKNQRARNKKS